MFNFCKIIKSIIIINSCILLLCSCQRYDIENGIFFVKAKSKYSESDSLEIAKNKVYNNLVNYISEKTERVDTNIIYYSLVDSTVVQFDDYEIKSSKFFNGYNTSIKINDNEIKNRLDDFIISFQRSGKINTTDSKTVYRAHADIDYIDSHDLYTKSVLERDAFRRAVENIKKQLLSDGFLGEDVSIIIENAYMIEETFGQKVYTVVVEVSL